MRNFKVLSIYQSTNQTLFSQLYDACKRLCFHVVFMPPKELWEAYSNRTVRPSVLQSVRPSVSPSVPLSCPVHISYILWVRNSKFGVWIHLGMAECRVPFSGHCDLDLDLWPSFYNNHVRSISLILFELGISNLVCGCILGWRSVAYHKSLWPWTWPLTQFLENCIESGAYLLYSLK